MSVSPSAAAGEAAVRDRALEAASGHGGGAGTRIASIDGLRTISVLLVIVSHILVASNLRVKTSVIDIPFFGRLGVSMFFVISGFVICRSLLAERRRYGRVSVSAFFVRRALRILPPLLFYTMVIVVLAWTGVLPEAAAGTVRGLTFTCNIPPPIAYCGEYAGAHLWSLSFEEQFYLVFPFVFILVGNRTMQTVVFLSLPVVAIVCKLAGLHHPGFYFQYLALIAFGVVAAYHEERLRRWCGRIPAMGFWLIVALFIGIAVLGGSRLANGVITLLAPPVLTFVLLKSDDIGPLRQALSRPVMVRLGMASYGIYLWQQLATYPFAGAGVGFYALSIAACLAWSMILFVWFEAPLMRRAGALSQRLQESGRRTAA